MKTSLTLTLSLSTVLAFIGTYFLHLTADNADPAVWLDTNIKGQLVSGKQAIGKGNIPEGPSGKFFTEFK